MIRIVKALLVLSIGLQALFYALQNVANLAVAHQTLGYVLSGTDHAVYTETLFFTSANPGLHWAALIIVLILEFSVGFFGIKGGWDLFRARSASAEAFQAAKWAGIMAAGLALLTWFGVFMTWGGAFFQMWQTQIGTGSLEGAFMIAIASAIVILFVCHTPDE